MFKKKTFHIKLRMLTIFKYTVSCGFMQQISRTFSQRVLLLQ